MTKIHPKFQVTVDKLGKLHIDDIVKFKSYIVKLKGEAEIVVKKKSNRKSRSNEQNRYMHGIVFQMLGDEIGCSMEEAKDALKQKFLSITIKGGLKSTKSTSSLSTVEIEEFLSKCRMLASTMFDCYIPLPNECNY